jgi:RND family efflux transporter MFP subunit
MAGTDLSKLKILSEERVRISGGRGRRRLARWIGLAMVALVVLGVLAWKGLLSAPVPVRTVKVAPVFPSRPLTVVNASGYVVAQRKAAVSSKATGRLEELFVEEGKSVKSGEVLARLENDDLQAALAEAKAGLRVAEATLRNAQAELHDATLQYNRQTPLRDSGAVSAQSFDAVEARYKKAVAMETSARFAVNRTEASVKVAEVNLEYSFIRAPFDGVILTKNADKGEVVAPFGAATTAKASVVTMADLDSLMVEVDVSESSLHRVRKDSPAEIRLDALPEDRFPGMVHMIVPTADRSKATVLVKVRFDQLDPRVLPEMSAKVAFLERRLKPDEQTAVLGIPVPAIRRNSGETVVLRVSEGRASQVPVKTGRQWDQTVEVLAGLADGDVIVAEASGAVSNGARVRLVE